MLWGRFTLHRLHDVIENSGDTYPNLQFKNGRFSRTGLAFRTRPAAPTQACTQTGAATKSQNDPIREERPRGRAWRDATSCKASSGVYSRAPRLCLQQLRPIWRTSPYLT